MQCMCYYVTYLSWCFFPSSAQLTNFTFQIHVLKSIWEGKLISGLANLLLPLQLHTLHYHLFHLFQVLLGVEFSPLLSHKFHFEVFIPLRFLHPSAAETALNYCEFLEAWGDRALPWNLGTFQQSEYPHVFRACCISMDVPDAIINQKLPEKKLQEVRTEWQNLELSWTVSWKTFSFRALKKKNGFIIALQLNMLVEGAFQECISLK